MSNKPTNYDYDKLFLAYEECRSDNTAHFRKLMELQKENEELKNKLIRADLLIKRNMGSSLTEFIASEDEQIKIDKLIGEL